jgi:hypothetical protein
VLVLLPRLLLLVPQPAQPSPPPVHQEGDAEPMAQAQVGLAAEPMAQAQAEAQVGPAAWQ